MKILRSWESHLPGFVFQSKLLTKAWPPVTEAIGVQKNRFDERYRINIMLLLANPISLEDEVIVFAHLNRDGVRFGADESTWWTLDALAGALPIVKDKALPWLENLKQLGELARIYRTAVDKAATVAEAYSGSFVSARDTVTPPFYLQVLCSLFWYMGNKKELAKYLDQWKRLDVSDARQFEKLLIATN